LGIKVTVSQKDLPTKYKSYQLIPTSDGISDTVYLLGDEYVLKVFENQTDEENILKLLDGLCVPKVVESFFIEEKQALIYTQIKGSSSKLYSLEIVKFLKRMHQKTKGKSTKNPMLFTQKNLEQMLKEADKEEFFSLYECIDISLKNDGIIHGDLFPDNAKFIRDRLSGVYDFSEACEGDFYFDLAVVCFSFGADAKEVLRIYGADISEEEFREYLKFAKLYYSVSRYLHKQKDFREFLW